MELETDVSKPAGVAQDDLEEIDLRPKACERPCVLDASCAEFGLQCCLEGKHCFRRTRLGSAGADESKALEEERLGASQESLADEAAALEIRVALVLGGQSALCRAKTRKDDAGEEEDLVEGLDRESIKHDEGYLYAAGIDQPSLKVWRGKAPYGRRGAVWTVAGRRGEDGERGWTACLLGNRWCRLIFPKGWRAARGLSDAVTCVVCSLHGLSSRQGD